MSALPGGISPLLTGAVLNQPDAVINNNTAATVRVGVIQVDDNGSAYNQNNSPNIFDDYLIESLYETDIHRYMAGITSPGPIGAVGPLGAIGGASAIPTAAFFQLSAPTTLWIVNWTAGRWGAVPDVPDPNIAASPGIGANWILLDVTIQVPRLDVDCTGSKPYYRVSGTYVYGCLHPSTNPFLDVNFPRAPVWDDVFSRKISLNSLKQNLITAGF